VKVVAIAGASGFVGKALVNFLKESGTYRLNLLTRDRLKLEDFSDENVQIHEGNLLDKNSLNEFVEHSSTLINLAFLATEDSNRNILAAKNLIEAATLKGVKRIIHCSTATVVGENSHTVIDEASTCCPRTEYEKIKLAIEEAFLQSSSNNLDIRILRPTAVFGPEGKNLLKFAEALDKGNHVLNFLRQIVFAKRKLNLVCLENVVGALQFLIEQDTERYGKVFIISDDDDPTNNYHDIQNKILVRLGKAQTVKSKTSLPPSILKILLSLKGRSNTNPERIYSSERIKSAGYQKIISFEAGIDRFMNWYLEGMQG
jgi:nucleoside-diphosphate-sugar epimerase